MARISRVGLGWTAPERVDWYESVEEWYSVERLVDYGSLIEAVCKGDCTGDNNTRTELTGDSVHGSWFYADPSVYYDFTNETVIPFIGHDTYFDGFDIRCSGMMLRTNGVSSGLEAVTTNNKRSLIEDCRITDINPSGIPYGVEIIGAGTQANQDILLRCVIDRANGTAALELVKQSRANGFGVLRNCVLIAGTAKYADGSNNVGLEVTDCVGIGTGGYDATSLILNTSSSEDTSGSAGLQNIDSTALVNVAGLDFRSRSDGPLNVQGTNTAFIGAALDVAAGDGITLTPLNSSGQRHVINREIDGSARTIPVTVTLTGDPTGGIQWRLVDNADDTPITGFDWSNFLSSPAAGQHTADITAPTSTGRVWYKLQLRFTANTSVTVETANEFAIGVIVVDNGQSNSQYRDSRTDNPPTVHADAAYCTTDGWQATFSTGNGAIAKVNALITLLDVPVGYYNNALISQPISYFVTGTGWVDLSSVIANQFLNYFELMDFDQGETDARQGLPEATYLTSQQTLLDNILQQMGRTQSEFTFGVNLGGNSNGYNVGLYTDETLEAIRSAKRSFVEANAGVIWGGHRIDLALVDTIHNTTVAYETAAEREVKSYAEHLGLDSVTGAGRSITSAGLSGNILTVVYSSGDNLTKIGTGPSTITEVSSDGFTSTIAITDTVVNNNNVVHTLASTPSGAVQVREYYGIDIDITTRPNLVFPSTITSAVVTSTLNITLTGIPDGDAKTALLDITDIDSPSVIPTQTLSYSSGTAVATVPVSAGTAIVSIEVGPNPKTTGGADYGVTT